MVVVVVVVSNSSSGGYSYDLSYLLYHLTY